MQDNPIDQLLLVWQHPINRQRYHIGRLWYQNNKYYFAYDKTEVERLLQAGLRLHPSFPDKNKVYQSRNLFGAFAGRLPARRRKDYGEIAARYNLPEDCTDYELLKASGGKLVTDNFELTSSIIFAENETVDMEFFVSGWSYCDGPENIDKLRSAQELQLRIEPCNQWDSNLILIKYADDITLGQVPIVYASILSKCILNGFLTKTRITGINPEAEPSEVLRVRFLAINTILNEAVY